MVSPNQLIELINSNLGIIYSSMRGDVRAKPEVSFIHNFVRMIGSLLPGTKNRIVGKHDDNLI
jgi:hypothetical protein